MGPSRNEFVTWLHNLERHQVPYGRSDPLIVSAADDFVLRNKFRIDLIVRSNNATPAYAYGVECCAETPTQV